VTTSLEITFHPHPESIRPLPGRIMLAVESNPDQIGSILIPETAQRHTGRDVSLFATVLSVGYGPFWYMDEVDPKTKRGGKARWHPGLTPGEVKAGDRVRFRALLSDLNTKRILTSVTRVDAVIEA
jgi:hypothetical protein